MSISSDSNKPKAKKGTAAKKTYGYLDILKNLVFGKKLTKEEFLSQSLKECCSRPIQDIDES